MVGGASNPLSTSMNLTIMISEYVSDCDFPLQNNDTTGHLGTANCNSNTSKMQIFTLLNFMALLLCTLLNNRNRCVFTEMISIRLSTTCA